MAEPRYEQAEAELRRRVSRLLADDAEWKTPRAALLNRLMASEWRAFLFGGAVRDLMLRSPYHAFRDIDVVIDGASTESLQAAFGPYVVRRTRFGGLHLDVEGWLFDLWPLADTWAFREHPALVQPRPEDLPRTTFMTIEAVVVCLGTQPGHPRQVFESGFYEALATRTIELNFEFTPYPKLNAVRSLITSSRLGFSIGPKLVRFLVAQFGQTDTEELVQVQRQHYGRVLMDADTLTERSRALTRWLHSNPRLAMPVQRPTQMTFGELEQAADFGAQLAVT